MIARLSERLGVVRRSPNACQGVWRLWLTAAELVLVASSSSSGRSGSDLAEQLGVAQGTPDLAGEEIEQI